ncbi:uncharacterized protein B0T23DRAFT_418376 [Neurospora hispaniola]|uniref:Uncharacterized protein n=1 Tax=Neurospora hispaniola TaxID=588809 RepID=A0AAJ0ID08_9PEZI|nr:hypothetical protein B0T23DRAFT_418376 [Neurospora hispaniola]
MFLTELYRESYSVICVGLCAAETEALILSIAGENRLPRIAKVMSSKISNEKLCIDNALRAIGQVPDGTHESDSLFLYNIGTAVSAVLQFDEWCKADGQDWGPAGLERMSNVVGHFPFCYLPSQA